jgi:mannosyltransferase OCH1-like enzyme
MVWKQQGGIYSDGPRIVYKKLNNEIHPQSKTMSCPTFMDKASRDTPLKRVHPIHAKVRRQNQIIQKLNLRNPTSAISQSTNASISVGSDANIAEMCLYFLV